MSKNLALETHAPAYLSVHDIHDYYGESYIVQGVSFNVHEGEILALLGRNGAGKTSTLRTIPRLDNPELVKGEIWLDHKNLHAMKSYEAATNGIALVPEDRRIIPGLSVEENLKEKLKMFHHSVKRWWRQSQTNKLLKIKVGRR